MVGGPDIDQISDQMTVYFSIVPMTVQDCLSFYDIAERERERKREREE